MVFFGSRQLSWSTLAILCRSLGTMLHSGVAMLKSWQVAGSQSPNPLVKQAANDVQDRLRRGEDLAAALRAQQVFPELVVEMTAVAEQTGMLPEVLEALADHYENLVRLRKMFIGAIIWPALQFFAAIFIIAALLVILGMISPAGAEKIDILGLGLSGVSGALAWLGFWFGGMISLYIIYQLLVKGFSGGALMHGLLLKIPFLGSALRNLAVARFSWAFALTQSAGMRIGPSVEAALKATANHAFIAATPQMTGAVREGEDFTTVLQITGLFPTDYLEMIRVGETTGTVPEAMQRIGPQLEDKARRSLQALTMAAGVVIWGMVAMMIAFLVIRVAMTYINMINDAANNALNGRI